MSHPRSTANLSSAGTLIAGMERALALALFGRRRRLFRRQLSYDPKKDCIAGFAGPKVTAMPVHCDHECFLVPEIKLGVASGALELQVEATPLGEAIDPAIEMSLPGFRDAQYLERGVRGTRFLNVSRLLGVAGHHGGKVRLRGRNLRWRGETARLHLSDEKVLSEDRVLVIGPHPDDAEIAAFGLYSETNATVVTLTTGDQSLRYNGSARSGIELPQELVRRIRVWDSLTIPQFGKVTWERAINLCFPDGRLQDMHSEPDRDFGFGGADGRDFVGLRRLNRSPLVDQNQAVCSWRSLVSDLCRIVEEERPSVIVTPHPQLDPHPDHVFASAAVCDAIDAAGLKDGRVFFYCAHNRRSELWPFGPQGAGVAFPPVLAEDGSSAADFYSHPLSEQRQRDKFIALEAMHDIRQIEGMGGPSLIAALRRAMDECRGFAHGMGVDPTDYLRRAVRPDELFFVASLPDAKTLTRRAVADFKPLWISGARL